MSPLWSYALTIIGITGLWCVTNRKSVGFAIGVAVQVLWIVYAVRSSQYGFIGSALAYGFVNARGWRNFRRADREAEDATQRAA